MQALQENRIAYLILKLKDQLNPVITCSNVLYVCKNIIFSIFNYTI